jgi:membrane-associated PAP2 superfamily phosphatase
MRAGMRHNKIALAALGLMPVLIVLLSTFTDIDLRLADAAYDARLGDFPWRHAWLAEVFSHILLKRALVGLGAGFIGAALWDLARPSPRLNRHRMQMRVVAGCAVLVPSIVAILKQLSSSHCPWDIDRYGGSAPYVRLLNALPAGIAPGHCMPAGHASSALWVISLAVLFLPARPRIAAAVFGAMLTFGMAVGWLQQMRGAHFLTHTLWSVWIACAVLFALLKVRRPHFPSQINRQASEPIASQTRSDF